MVRTDVPLTLKDAMVRLAVIVSVGWKSVTLPSMMTLSVVCPVLPGYQPKLQLPAVSQEVVEAPAVHIFTLPSLKSQFMQAAGGEVVVSEELVAAMVAPYEASEFLTSA